MLILKAVLGLVFAMVGVSGAVIEFKNVSIGRIRDFIIAAIFIVTAIVLLSDVWAVVSR